MEKADFRFDKRIIERHLRSGVVTREEHKSYLENLKDLTEDSLKFEAILTQVDKKIATRSMLNEDDEL